MATTGTLNRRTLVQARETTPLWEQILTGTLGAILIVRLAETQSAADSKHSSGSVGVTIQWRSGGSLNLLASPY
jgi:hypothetical protein